MNHWITAIRLRKRARPYLAHNGGLWRRHAQGRHQFVVPPHQRSAIVREAHDNLSHKGFRSTLHTVLDRLLSCKTSCATSTSCDKQPTKVCIPPTVATHRAPVSHHHPLSLPCRLSIATEVAQIRRTVVRFGVNPFFGRFGVVGLARDPTSFVSTLFLFSSSHFSSLVLQQMLNNSDASSHHRSTNHSPVDPLPASSPKVPPSYD